MEERFEELKDKVTLDESRLEHELVYYIEKFDVTEEKVRLNAHLKYFSETMNSDDAAGRNGAVQSGRGKGEQGHRGPRSGHSDGRRVSGQTGRHAGRQLRGDRRVGRSGRGDSPAGRECPAAIARTGAGLAALHRLRDRLFRNGLSAAGVAVPDDRRNGGDRARSADHVDACHHGAIAGVLPGRFRDHQPWIAPGDRRSDFTAILTFRDAGPRRTIGSLVAAYAGPGLAGPVRDPVREVRRDDLPAARDEIGQGRTRAKAAVREGAIGVMPAIAGP